MLTRGLARVVNVRPEEVHALLWAFVYFFCLLSSYYILRPLRDEMGVAAGVAQLQWLFTGTFALMLVAVPLFGALVARLPRRRFVPWVYRFFIVNILIFFVLLHLGEARVTVARGFFLWVSVYNLFVVTVFWGFMSDIFRNEQGRRLFGFIAAGGTLGALVGPSLTAMLAVPLGPINLLLISALLLEGATQCAKRLLSSPQALPRPAGVAQDEQAGTNSGTNSEANPGTNSATNWVTSAATNPANTDANERLIGGSMLAGFTEVARSPYLMLICAHVLLLSLTSTFLYFQQAAIVAGAFDSPAERTRVFALIDLSVGLLCLGVQVALTGRLIMRFGVGPALAFLALVTLAGFLVLAVSPVLGVVIAFQAIKRAAEFAIANPARETLFTVVTREQKYKSKSFIDTAVFRGGDAASGWVYTGLRGLGLELSAIALIAVPIAALWAGLLLVLGRKQEQLAGAPQPGP